MANTISVNLSSEQIQALDVTRSIAVRAGAGSGKTRVLTERYIKILKVYNSKIEDIVAITFTEKAALEMKNRIRERIQAEICSEENHSCVQQWKQYRDELINANISTIHAFCQKIISENFWYLNIDPSFKVLEDIDRITNIKKITEECIKEYFEDSLNQGIKEFFEIYGVNYIVEGKFSAPIVNAYFKIKEKGADLDKVEQLTELDNKMGYLHSLELNFEEEHVRKINHVEKLAVNILKAVDDKYSKFKRQNNALDFNDLEILTLKVLENDEILLNYKSKFKYFMVDEFQDVNPLQSKLIYKFVCDNDGNIEENKLFSVGDYKQSIYGFRGSDCSIFNDLCSKLGSNVKFLSTCYRSSPEIIDTVNNVFSSLISNYDELNYDSKKSFNGNFVDLIKIAKTEEESEEDTWKKVSEILKNNDDSETLEKILVQLQNTKPLKSKKDNNSDILAQTIKQMNDRGVCYKEIAILIRAKTNLIAIENSLKKASIPYCILGGIGFWDSQEVCDIVNLYKFINNPKDLTCGIAVLRSPLFGFCDNLILELSNYLKQNKSDILTSLQKLALNNITERDKVNNAYLILQQLIRCSGLLCAAELMNTILKLTSYEEILLTQVGGYQKIRNIEKLLQIAKDFDDKGLYNSKDFINYVDTYKNSSSREGQAMLDTEDSDAVKILTIHMSKGLQFKNVIIPDIHIKLTKTDKNDAIIFNEQFGIVASYEITNEKSKKEELNVIHTYLTEQKLQRELEESKRVLYVGMTRAEEYLCLVGEDQEDKKNEQNTYMKQLNYAIEHTKAPYVKVKTIDSLGETLNSIDKNFDISYINEFADNLNSVQYDTDKIKSIMWKYDKQTHNIFSISQYIQYLDCTRKYFLLYKAKLSEDMLERDAEFAFDDVIFDFSSESISESNVPANIRGSILHKVLEQALIRGLKNEDEIFELGKKISSQWIQSYNESTVDEFLIFLKKYIRNYLKISDSFKTEVEGNFIKSYLELPFRVEVRPDSNLLTNGVIDRIDIYETDKSIDLYIIDYKTNIVRNKKDIEQYEKHYLPQMLLYCKSAELLFKGKTKAINIKGAYLFFVDCGEYKKVEFNQERINELLNELNSKFTQISKMNDISDYICNFGERCNVCEYKEICG